MDKKILEINDKFAIYEVVEVVRMNVDGSFKTSYSDPDIFYIEYLPDRNIKITYNYKEYFPSEQ